MEDINELALAVEEMQQTDGETLKYLSVLSVEQPEDFPAALRLAVDLDDYERIIEGTYEYGQSVLRRIGANDELLKTIDGYMDSFLIVTYTDRAAKHTSFVAVGSYDDIYIIVASLFIELILVS